MLQLVTINISFLSLSSTYILLSPKMDLESHGKQTVLVGPWGGQEGHHWDDGVYSTIRQVEITHGADVIDSIRTEYDLNGRSIWSEIHGGNGGASIDKVRLAYPEEYLTSVHGYYGSVYERGPVFVRALTLESNKRMYGPFGVEKGTYFAFPKVKGKIVGFLGKCGWYLDAIGAYVEPIQDNKIAPNPVYYSQQQQQVSQAANDQNNKIAPNSQQQVSHAPYYQNNKIAPNPVYYSQQQQVSHANDNYEYSMIKGSLGTNYDLIVAFRQKDDRAAASPPINLSPKITHDYSSSSESKKINHQNGGGIQKRLEKKIEKVPSREVNGVVTSGPWGGSGGTAFDDGVYNGVRQINLSRNVCIVAIRVCYDKNEQPVWGSKNGGKGSFKKEKIVFDYPSEILTHVTGYMGPTMKVGPNVIKSITFHTTKGKHGPYGEEEGELFSTKLKEGCMIVGFHGRKGLFLDAIGVHCLEGKVAPPPSSSTKTMMKTVAPTSINALKSNNQAALVAKKSIDNYSEWPFKFGKRSEVETDEGVHRTVKDPAPYGTGPWGGEGGKPWDDGVFTGIKQIILTITDAICCIEIEYDRNGQSVWSVKHGGAGGQTANRVKLDPNEVLTCISGYYGPIKKDQPGSCKVIHSLTFHTSRKKYGPFGEEIGTYFASGTTEGKVVGFHGRCSTYLDAIGVHMQHWLGNKKSPKASLMKYFS